MKYILIALGFVLWNGQSQAQIFFQNPSFEGLLGGVDTVPLPWRICSGTPDIFPLSCCPEYLPAYDGLTYVDLGMDGTSSSDSIVESIGGKLSCNLIPNKNTHFTCYAYSVNDPFWVLGKLQVWGGHSICSQEKLLWETKNIDTVWTKLYISFLPLSNYNFIELRVNDSINGPFGCKIGIDNLSAITVDGYNFISTKFSDTIIRQGSCISLGANSDDTTVNYQWSSLPAGFIATGANATDCPFNNIKYICTATYGCGYKRMDTINVNVLPNGIDEIRRNDIVIINTPSQWQIQNLPAQVAVSIYNLPGQLVYYNDNYKNDFDISVLPSAMYLYRIRFEEGEERSGKMVVIH